MKPHKIRTSESRHPQKIVEYTQGGILIRFNEFESIKEDTTFYECTEFWVEVNEPKIDEIVEEKGFELTKKYKDKIVEVEKII